MTHSSAALISRVALFASLFLPSGNATGQSVTQVATTSTSAFAPGGQDLFVFDVAATRGTFPRGVSRLSGSVEWVTKEGRQMLKATERSELLITLPVEQILPQNFTIEVDLIPRNRGPERDVTLEGKPSITQDGGSAHLEVMTDANFGTIYVVGGGTNIPEFPMPEAVRATLPESFTRVGVSVEGNTIRFFINGTEILPDPEQPSKKVQARFARGNVLRVTLGGVAEDDGGKPVYLSRVRLATGAPVTVATALPATTTGTITPIASNPSTQLERAPLSGTPTILSNGPAPTGLTVTGTPGTASLTWTALTGAIGYRVERAPVGSTNWLALTPGQVTETKLANDRLPDAFGTYTYRVIAYQSDGRFGAATVNFTPPNPSDPTQLRARFFAPGQVSMGWQNAPFARSYLVSGPGVPAGTTTSEPRFIVSAAPAGVNTYNVASIFEPGGVLTAAATWPSVTVGVPAIPTPAVRMITLPNGEGSLAEFNRHVCAAGKWVAEQLVRPNGWCDTANGAAKVELFPLLNLFGIEAGCRSSAWWCNGKRSFAPANDETDYLQWAWGRNGADVLQAGFIDVADLYRHRTVGCVTRGTGPSAATLCWAMNHGGPDLGNPNPLLDSFLGSLPSFSRTNSVSIIIHTAQDTKFFSYGLSYEGCDGVVDVSERRGCMRANATTKIETKDQRFLPHACLSCHGGRYEPNSGKVTGATLLALDPRGFHHQGGRSYIEEPVRHINGIVYTSSPSRGVRTDIERMYRGLQAVMGATVDDATVPPAWAEQPNVYRQVYRPYCKSCHTTIEGPLGFTSWSDLVRERERIRRSVCAGTMPHSEVPFWRFWTDSGAVSLPGRLLEALGYKGC